MTGALDRNDVLAIDYYSAAAMQAAEYMEMVPQGEVVPKLLLTGICKLALNPNYNLAIEALQYKEFLSAHGANIGRSFQDYFYDVFKGDTFCSGVMLPYNKVDIAVLNEDGKFRNDIVRKLVMESLEI